MKLPKDFGKRVAAIAETTPRDAVGNLLKTMLPRRPVHTKPVPPPMEQPKPTPTLEELIDEFSSREWDLNDMSFGTTTDRFTAQAKRAKKRRSVYSAKSRYRLLVPSATRFHRKGTWTHAMVDAVVYCADEGAHAVGIAEKYLRLEHPEYADKNIDWHWLANVKEYIAFE